MKVWKYESSRCDLSDENKQREESKRKFTSQENSHDVPNVIASAPAPDFIA